MVIESNSIPCKECLVLARCREREVIPCDKLYYWITSIDKMYEAQKLLPKPIVLPSIGIIARGDVIK